MRVKTDVKVSKKLLYVSFNLSKFILKSPAIMRLLLQLFSNADIIDDNLIIVITCSWRSIYVSDGYILRQAATIYLAYQSFSMFIHIKTKFYFGSILLSTYLISPKKPSGRGNVQIFDTVKTFISHFIFLA